MCALRWYVKSLYKHLFLEDISKHARVTHFLIYNSKAPWGTRPQIGVWVANTRSCDIDELKKFFFNVNLPPSPELWCWEEEGSQNAHAYLCDPASSQHHNLEEGGWFTLIFFLTRQDHSYVLLYQPTDQFRGASLKAPWNYDCHKLGSEWPLRVWIYLLRKGAYRYFLHIILAHTISNKLVSKVFAQKKWGKKLWQLKYVFRFQWFQVGSPQALSHFCRIMNKLLCCHLEVLCSIIEPSMHLEILPYKWWGEGQWQYNRGWIYHYDTPPTKNLTRGENIVAIPSPQGENIGGGKILIYYYINSMEDG